MLSIQKVNVLVTGADGFIGSHLVERLLVEGAKVSALCLYNSEALLGVGGVVGLPGARPACARGRASR